jgi:chitodextrinase
MFAAKIAANSCLGQSRLATWLAVLMFAISSGLEPAPAFAFGIKQTPPSTPGNFHVTAVTSSSVSFAWTASKPGTDPKFIYNIVRNDGYSLNVGNVTSTTWSIGLQGGQTYSFFIYAADTDNKVSAHSPSVTVTLPTPPPPPPPAAPVLSLVGVTATTITVSWPTPTGIEEEDIGGYVLYTNGVMVNLDDILFDGETEWTVPFLAPDTTYTLNVQAVDVDNQRSPLSNPVTATTPANTNNIPPTAPTGLNGASDGGGEAIVSWNPSTSPYEPQSDIEYLFYVNGSLEADASTIGDTIDQYVFPNSSGDPQEIYVVAVDQYGNISPPSNVLTMDF